LQFQCAAGNSLFCTEQGISYSGTGNLSPEQGFAYRDWFHDVNPLKPRAVTVIEAESDGGGKTHGGSYLVMAGLVPAIPIVLALSPPNRDRGDKPGDDELAVTRFDPVTEIMKHSYVRWKLGPINAIIGLLSELSTAASVRTGFRPRCGPRGTQLLRDPGENGFA